MRSNPRADNGRDVNPEPETVDDRDPSWPPPFRDGQVHVMSERCSTCVFRDGNRMRLHQGRLAEMIDHSLRNDTAFACHQTLSYGGHTDEIDGEAICRGFYDSFGDRVTPLRLATRMGMLSEDAPPTGR